MTKQGNLIGFVPQSNELFINLNVFENLKFFSLIYGLNSYELIIKANNVSKIFEIENILQ